MDYHVFMTTQEKLQAIFEAALKDDTDFIGKRPQPSIASRPVAVRPPEDLRQQPNIQEREFHAAHSGAAG